jgi:hypothetical protein
MNFNEFLTSNLLSGIFGALIGSIGTYYLNKQNEKLKLTLEFHKEFYGTEMSKHRRAAKDFLKKYPEANYDDIHAMGDEGSLSLVIIMRFFQRFWHCTNVGALKNQFAADLFVDIFYYWYYLSFEPNLLTASKNFTAKEEMKQLHKWLTDKTTRVDCNELKNINQKVLSNIINTARAI